MDTLLVLMIGGAAGACWHLHNDVKALRRALENLHDRVNYLDQKLRLPAYEWDENIEPSTL